jgi:hypothetical protein
MSIAIETRFRGVHFRSRLEARWAAMFDLLGWRWEYEPVDLAGYIPDFVLMFPAGPVLVEVKPAFTVEALIDAAANKIDRSGWKTKNNNRALIVGASWHLGGAVEGDPDTDQTVASAYPHLGAMCHGGPIAGPVWGDAVGVHCMSCNRASVQGRTVQGSHEGGVWTERAVWTCAMCGVGIYDALISPLDVRTDEAWREAGNAVRWKGTAA